MGNKEKRTGKIKNVIKELYGMRVPMFYWDNHEPMMIFYDEETDSLKCDCGVGVPVNRETDDIDYEYMWNLVFDLEEAVQEEYKTKYNIILYYDD